MDEVQTHYASHIAAHVQGTDPLPVTVCPVPGCNLATADIKELVNHLIVEHRIPIMGSGRKQGVKASARRDPALPTWDGELASLRSRLAGARAPRTSRSKASQASGVGDADDNASLTREAALDHAGDTIDGSAASSPRQRGGPATRSRAAALAADNDADNLALSSPRQSLGRVTRSRTAALARDNLAA